MPALTLQIGLANFSVPSRQPFLRPFLMYPQELKYSETHEWARIEGNTVTVGITDYAVKELTDLTYLELPSPGEAFKTGDSFGVIESVKATSDLYTPVAGEVIQVNEELPNDLDILMEDAYQKGWMVKLRASDINADLASLLSPQDYQNRVDDH